MEKIKIAFVCVHNSCRSQIAEGIAKLKYSEYFESYSAGTKLKKEINPDAVRIFEEIYLYDLSKTQKPKLLADIPEIDILITMGCNVECPYVNSKYNEDFGIDDPSGKDDLAFIDAINQIEEKLETLVNKIINKEIVIAK